MAYTLRLRKDEDPRIEEFLKAQSGGYGDVLRYLIEKEIAENGVRDISALIPSRRSIDLMKGSSPSKNKASEITKVFYADKNSEEVENRNNDVLQDKPEESSSIINKEEVVSSNEEDVIEEAKIEDEISVSSIENKIEEDINESEKEKEDKEEDKEIIIPSCFL